MKAITGNKRRKQYLGLALGLALLLGAGFLFILFQQDRYENLTVPGPGERLRERFVDSSPTEAAPKLQLKIPITDQATGKPVGGALIHVKIGDKEHNLLAKPDGSVAEMEFALTPDVVSLIEITIIAKGYEPWNVEVSFKLRHSKKYEIPVELVPVSKGEVGG